MKRSYVVTGGGRGVGRGIVERLLSADCSVVAIELEASTLRWTQDHPSGRFIIPVVGDASDEGTAEEAARLAEENGQLVGWVNNAALFRDASVHNSTAREILDLIELNLAPAIVGCTVAVRHFLKNSTRGAIVNVSSHQAQRPVRGALPYATAKAAIEGLTRALAVDYGPYGIRINAVALGSISTERYEAYLKSQPPEGASRIEQDIRRLHPLGRIGQLEDVANAVSYLLSDTSSFVTGTILPVDGGRSSLGLDPEERDPVA